MFQGASATLSKLKADRVIVAKRLQLKPETIIAAGAVSVDTPLTFLTTAGAIALTLADGRDGDVKIIIMHYDGGTATLTPAHFRGGTTATLTFDDVYDSWMGVFFNGYWWTIGTPTATIA